MLRQDPDVVMVGEIRDEETAAIAAPAYAAELDDICPGCGQAYDALPLASIRGRWALAAGGLGAWLKSAGCP